MNENQKQKTQKTKGPIRTEAVVPFLIFSLVVGLYFKLFFDSHLRSAMEFVGYHVVGAEVNVASVQTSFFQGTFKVSGIQITNPDIPTKNMLEIGEIRFGVLWDGLLRARIIIEEMATESIKIDTQRQKPGKVKPPEPKKEKSDEPSAFEKKANELKDKALDKVQDEYSNNVLGDVAALLAGSSAQDQASKIEGSLPSKAKLKEFEISYKEKQKGWEKRLKSLPQSKEIQALSDRLAKVKTKDFKSPQELESSLKEVDAILKDGDAKFKMIQATGNDLQSEMKTLDQELKSIDAMIKKDMKDLEARFRLPKLDAASMSRAIFQQYLNPYIAKFNRFQSMAEKYVPPNIMKKVKGGKEEPDETITPHPRAKGMSYEFSRPNSYPMFWIKRISISSQAGADPDSGDIAGRVTDITSNQKLIGRPTVFDAKGSFPGLGVLDFASQLTVDVMRDESRVAYNFRIGSYPIDGKNLVDSADAKIAFKKASGSMSSEGQLIGLKDFSFNLNNKFTNMQYDISSPNQTVDGILREVFSGIPAVTLEASGRGALPNLSLNVVSNLGAELQQGFEKQLQKKIDEARSRLQAEIDEQVGKEKAKLQADFDKAKGQIESEVKKLTDQWNSEKSKGEAKANQAKKEAEDSAKRKLEAEARKALGDDAQKKLDELKKKLKF